MKFAVRLPVLALAMSALYGQTCAPARILPGATISATLDDNSCRLSDATPYAAYRFDLPARGRLTLDLSSAADLIAIVRDSSGAQIASGAGIAQPIEAGSYQILVNGRTPGQAGAFVLKSSFAADPWMWCSMFPLLGLNQSANGTLGSYGCVTPAGAPYDAYLLNTFGSGALTITASSIDFNPTVTVRGADGSALGSGSGTVTVAVDADSRYQVVVTSPDAGSDYIIGAAFQPADEETCRASGTITDSMSSDAAITPDSCNTTIAGSGDLAYFSYYNLTVPAAGLADLKVTSRDFDSTVYLLDEAGNLLALDSGGAGGTGPHTGSEIRMQLSPGNYLVQVFSAQASGGAYTLSYQFSAGAPAPCTPAAANPGDALSGDLSPASCRTSLGIADLYTITLPASGTLDVGLDAPAFTSILAIRDSKDNLIVMDEDFEGLGVAHLSADLPAGSYTLMAAANSGAGHYQMTPAFAVHDLKPCTFVQPLDINGGYIQKLGQGSCPGANGMPVDWYEFTLPSDGVALAVMTSSEVDGYLTLYDNAGNVLRSDDNSYADRDPLIVQYLPAGTYRLAARAASNTPGGLYEVDVRTTLGSRPPFCSPAGRLALGGSVTANLSFTACQYPDATFADIYQFSLTANTNVALQLDSSDFDAYLVLLDAAGNVLDQDDDAGGGTNARITHQLPPGTYYAAAKPFSGYYNIGGYTLTLSKVQ